MKCGLLLDVVIRESATVLQLLASEDQALLVRGNSLLVLDLALDIVDGVGGLNLEGDGPASQGLDENLHGCLEKNVVGVVCAAERLLERRGESDEVTSPKARRSSSIYAGGNVSLVTRNERQR